MTEPSETEPDRETEIPPDVAEQLRIVHRLEEPPRTLSEWGVAIGSIADREDIDVGLAALCTTDQSPHRARFDGTTQHFVCVQDAFIVPYVVDDVETVEVTTESPVSGEPIEATLTDDGVETEPSGAVMSVGVATDLSEPAADAGSPELAYGKICPYGHAFRNREEYEEWTRTVDAVTMVAPLSDAFRLGSAIGDAIE